MQTVSSVFARSPQSWYYLNLWRSPIIVSFFTLSAVKFEKNIYDFQIIEGSSFRQSKWKWGRSGCESLLGSKQFFLVVENIWARVCRVEDEKSDAVPVYWYTGEDKALAKLECWCGLTIYSLYWISGQRKWEQTCVLAGSSPASRAHSFIPALFWHFCSLSDCIP